MHISTRTAGYRNLALFAVNGAITLSGRQFAELQTRLRGRVYLDEDNIRFYPVSALTLGQLETWGLTPPVTKPATSVIV